MRRGARLCGYGLQGMGAAKPLEPAQEPRSLLDRPLAGETRPQERRDERAGWGNGEHRVVKLDRLVADGILVRRLPDAEIEMRKAASGEVFEQGGEENFAGRKSRGCAVAVEGIG